MPSQCAPFPARRRVRPRARPKALARAFRPLLAVLLPLLASCAPPGQETTVLKFWAMGREGEVVRELMTEFEAENPGLRVDVQQIPWSAAHEKLLTAFVGRSTPDVAQLGNTWVAEFAALEALVPLAPYVDASSDVAPQGYFPGIWDTNVIDGELLALPWYVDTRLLFYRSDLLEEAHPGPFPRTWAEWREALAAIRDHGGPDQTGIFLPTNEWTVPMVLGLQAGSPLLAEGWTRGAFSGPRFREALAFYLDLHRSGLAPAASNNDIVNLYQEFARGRFAMYVTGPWNLGEFARRLPPELQDDWATAPLPGPDASRPGVSLAGGSSLVLFRGSEKADAAWKLVEFLSRPEQQLKFYELSGNLPVRRESWNAPELSGDPHIRSFGRQLELAVATPKIPEWEQIAMRVQARVEEAVLLETPIDSVLAKLDREVDLILEKRRWLVERLAEERARR